MILRQVTMVCTALSCQDAPVRAIVKKRHFSIREAIALYLEPSPVKITSAGKVFEVEVPV